MPAAFALKMQTLKEAQEQKDFFADVEKLRPYYPDLWCIWHTPNGAFLGPDRARYGAELKALGVQPGVPDITVAVARGGYHGLYIEMKRRNASPSDTSPDQRACHTRLREQGYRVEVCKGRDAAWDVLKDYLNLEI